MKKYQKWNTNVAKMCKMCKKSVKNYKEKVEKAMKIDLKYRKHQQKTWKFTNKMMKNRQTKIALNYEEYSL